MSATPQVPPLAKLERAGLIGMLQKGMRHDGRALNQVRELKVRTGVIERANGSAEVHLGRTKVLAGIKIDVGEPYRDAPDQGVLSVNAELVPLASPSFEAGPPDENAIELARVVDRGLRSSGAIDLRALCIEEGRKVFTVFVDIYVLDHDGNFIDASAMAALAALLTCKMRAHEAAGGEVTFKEGYVPLPVKNQPVAVTVAKVDEVLIVDPSLEEEQIMSARLTITVDSEGRLCAMQKGGLGSFKPSQVERSIELAVEASANIRKKILEAIEGKA